MSGPEIEVCQALTDPDGPEVVRPGDDEYPGGLLGELKRRAIHHFRKSSRRDKWVAWTNMLVNIVILATAILVAGNMVDERYEAILIVSPIAIRALIANMLWAKRGAWHMEYCLGLRVYARRILYGREPVEVIAAELSEFEIDMSNKRPKFEE